MADRELTDVSIGTIATAAAGDLLYAVDVSDTSGDPAGTTKSLSLSVLKSFLLGNLVALAGDITPAQLTADQNDWTPTGLADAVVIRVDADQRRTITGITGGEDGRLLILINVGAAADSEIILAGESTSSTAANRFAGGGEYLAPGDAILMMYDGTASRWRRIAAMARANQGVPRRKQPIIETDYLTITANNMGEFNTVAVSVGTLNSPLAGTVTKDHPGVLRIRSSTTANSGVRSQMDSNQILLGGGEVYEAVFNLITLTNTTHRFGFHDSNTSADAVDGAYIELPAGSGNAVLKTASNSVRTTSATIAALSTSTWYTAVIVVDEAAANVTAFIFDSNGNLLGSQTNSANIPTASGRETGAGWISTNSTTTATDLAHLDYQSVSFTKPLNR